MTLRADTNESDDALMRRVAKGDGLALDALFMRHRQRVFALSYRCLSSRAEAEDVTQETFLRVLSAASSYREEGSFRTWLLTICSRLCMKKQARHSSWRERLVGFFHPVMESTPDGSADPVEELLEKEEAARVRRAVRELPADQRMALLLAGFEELSYEEIASAMGRSVSSVTSLLWRARTGLRASLGALRDENAEESARMQGVAGSK